MSQVAWGMMMMMMMMMMLMLVVVVMIAESSHRCFFLTKLLVFKSPCAQKADSVGNTEIGCEQLLLALCHLACKLETLLKSHGL